MITREGCLLDLRFLEIDMLAHNGIIFAEGELFGLRARVLFRGVIEPGVRSADQLDLDGCWLRHDLSPFLAFRELEGFAGLGLAVFLPLNSAAIAREEASRLYRRTQHRLKLGQRLRNTVLHSTGLA